jgi:hypothetical protein
MRMKLDANGDIERFKIRIVSPRLHTERKGRLQGDLRASGKPRIHPFHPDFATESTIHSRLLFQNVRGNGDIGIGGTTGGDNFLGWSEFDLCDDQFLIADGFSEFENEITTAPILEVPQWKMAPLLRDTAEY